MDTMVTVAELDIDRQKEIARECGVRRQSVTNALEYGVNENDLIGFFNAREAGRVTYGTECGEHTYTPSVQFSTIAYYICDGDVSVMRDIFEESSSNASNVLDEMNTQFGVLGRADVDMESKRSLANVIVKRRDDWFEEEAAGRSVVKGTADIEQEKRLLYRELLLAGLSLDWRMYEHIIPRTDSSEQRLVRKLTGIAVRDVAEVADQTTELGFDSLRGIIEQDPDLVAHFVDMGLAGESLRKVLAVYADEDARSAIDSTNMLMKGMGISKRDVCIDTLCAEIVAYRRNPITTEDGAEEYVNDSRIIVEFLDGVYRDILNSVPAEQARVLHAVVSGQDVDKSALESIAWYFEFKNPIKPLLSYHINDSAKMIIENSHQTQ